VAALKTATQDPDPLVAEAAGGAGNPYPNRRPPSSRNGESHNVEGMLLGILTFILGSIVYAWFIVP